MTEHDLKTWPAFFERLQAGEKPYEVRRYDRRYQAGDTLLLREWDPSREAYTGRSLRADVLEVLRAEDAPEGLERGFCALTIRVHRLECRGLVVAVQALQGWLQHHSHCGIMQKAASTTYRDDRTGAERTVSGRDPDDELCTCGLADEWRRRFFPLGQLGEICQSIIAGEPFKAEAADALPGFWRDAVLKLAGRTGLRIRNAGDPPLKVVKDDPRA